MIGNCFESEYTMEDIEYDDDLILLRSSYQINEYSIMEDFIDSLDNEHTKSFI